MEKVIELFLEYVQIDTESAEVNPWSRTFRIKSYNSLIVAVICIFIKPGYSIIKISRRRI